MVDSEKSVIERIEILNVYKHGDRRAPHKPLLILIAIEELLKGHRGLPYVEVENRLLPLLKAYAPPVKSRHQPELPYWHLQTDGLWVVQGGDGIPRTKGGFPTKAGLRQTSAGFSEEVADALVTDRSLLLRVVELLLYEHFPSSVHDDILAQVGLADFQTGGVARPTRPSGRARRRDPAFREKVLRAYEYQCAVTGFRAALGGSYFGCEAAHVQWHAYNGPDTVDNGICVEPTLHKLLDAGAWTLTDDRRILVSKDYTGSSAAVSRLRDIHGQSLRDPLAGDDSLSVEFIRWHREPELGGVFRGPHLPL